MFRSIGMIALAVSMVIGNPPSGAAAQIVVAPVAVVAQAGDDGAAGASVQPGGSGLPARTPPPRTMSDRWPVFAVFAIVWVALVGYTLSFNGRLKRIAAALAANETRAVQDQRSTRR